MKKIDLTPEEHTCEVEGVEIVFHNLDTLTLSKLFHDIKDPEARKHAIGSHVKEIRALDADGNQLKPEDFYRLPIGVLTPIQLEFMKHCMRAAGIDPESALGKESESRESA